MHVLATRPNNINPVVSIIIPCYNSAATIAATLESCLAWQAAEVIAVDDGSSDSTVKILQGFINRGVKILIQENSGVSVARNLGFKNSRGHWIQFLDSDDLICGGSLKRRIDTAIAKNADIIVTDWREFHKDNDLIAGALAKPLSSDWETLTKKGTEIACSTTFWAPPAAILYKRSIVEAVGGFREDLKVVEDARFLFDAAFAGAKFVHLNELGAYYRLTPKSLSRTQPTRFLLCQLLNAQQIERLWVQRDGALSHAQTSALKDIYGGVASGLVRLGHPAALIAAKNLQRHRGTFNPELRYGLHLLRIAGSSITKAVFWMGRSSKALGRCLRDWRSLSP